MTTRKTTTTKAQLATDNAITNIANATTPEAKHEAIEEGSKAVMDAINAMTPEQRAKAVKDGKKAMAKAILNKKETKGPMFTCSEAMGMVMKANPKATAEVLINKADTLYIKKTGKESNIFQMGKYHQFATHFLKGYNSK